YRQGPVAFLRWTKLAGIADDLHGRRQAICCPPGSRWCIRIWFAGVKMRRRLLTLAVGFTSLLNAQSDWPGYGHDKGGQRFSPLTQINTTNVSHLVPAWTFEMKREGIPFRASQSIPLVVNGVMYVSWPFNHVAAIQPESGQVIWEFTARSGY